MEWKDVVGYEGFYKINNLGDVKSVEREVVCGKYGGTMIRKERNMSKYENKDGYYTVNLSKNGSNRIFTIHRLVAIAFLGKPTDGKIEVNHIDANRKNNMLENLEWVTHGENVLYSYKNGNKCNKGENNGRSKLKRNDIEKIKELSVKGLSGVAISKMFKVSSSSIYRIIKNEGWV